MNDPSKRMNVTRFGTLELNYRISHLHVLPLLFCPNLNLKSMHQQRRPMEAEVTYFSLIVCASSVFVICCCVFQEQSRTSSSRCSKQPGFSPNAPFPCSHFTTHYWSMWDNYSICLFKWQKHLIFQVVMVKSGYTCAGIISTIELHTWSPIMPSCPLTHLTLFNS